MTHPIKDLIEKTEAEFNGRFPQELVRKSLNWGMESDPKPELRNFLSSKVTEAYEAGRKDREEELEGILSRSS